MNKAICIILSFTALLYTNKALTQSTVQRYDVIISEIMADPTPSIGLPSAEYVELYNRSHEDLLLVNWKLKVGNTVKSLPTFTLDSNDYVVIIAEKYFADFQDICANIISLSSLSITDAGQTLTLIDGAGEVVHSITFKKSWHTESIKQDGGWSLEMMDTALPCLGSENWNSSTDPAGGTPGRTNSVQTSLADNSRPQMERTTLLDSLTLRVFFSEPIVIDNTLEFQFHPAANVWQISEVPPLYQALDLHLSEPLQSDVIYNLQFTGQLCDCAGNRAPENSIIQTGVPRAPNPGDIVINEVLSHPFNGTDADFVELFNKSSHIIDLKDIKIGSGGDTIPTKAVVIAGSGMQLMPHAYCAICKDKKTTLTQYYCPDENGLFACDSLPAYANSSGVVFLSTIDLRTIDRLAYNEEMHYAKLLTTEGVSLERASANLPTQDERNWHSAASSVGFATPGYRNSQATTENLSEEIQFEPEVFSPDNDGFDDYTTLHLRFSEGDNRLTVKLYNSQGQCVKTLVNNELCGTEAHYIWDGTDLHQQLLTSGIYVAIIQWWTLEGKSKRLRRVVCIR